MTALSAKTVANFRQLAARTPGQGTEATRSKLNTTFALLTAPHQGAPVRPTCLRVAPEHAELLEAVTGSVLVHVYGRLMAGAAVLLDRRQDVDKFCRMFMACNPTTNEDDVHCLVRVAISTLQADFGPGLINQSQAFQERYELVTTIAAEHGLAPEHLLDDPDGYREMVRRLWRTPASYLIAINRIDEAVHPAEEVELRLIGEAEAAGEELTNDDVLHYRLRQFRAEHRAIATSYVHQFWPEFDLS